MLKVVLMNRLWRTKKRNQRRFKRWIDGCLWKRILE